MKLPDAEFNQLMFMKEILNETEARKINVYLNVGKPKADNKLYLKVKTRLFEDIFAELHRQNPSITKEIYPAIAVSFATNPKLVERSIRTAIETAWLHRDNDIWRLYFPPGANGEIPRPTNADFVARLAEYIRYH
jgi:hypothetical protein